MQVSQEGSVDSKTAQKQGEEWHFRITCSDSCATGSEQELDAKKAAKAASVQAKKAEKEQQEAVTGLPR